MISRSEITFWNARGLFAHDRLTSLQLFTNANRPLALCLCEARLDPSKPVPSLHGYIGVSKPVSSRSAGLITFVRKDYLGRIAFKRRTDLEQSAHALVLEMKLPTRPVPFLLANCYHHRVGGLFSAEWTGLKATLDACVATGLSVLTTADLNARHEDWDAKVTDSFGMDLSGFCSDRFLTILNSICCPGVATFPLSGSTLDIAICSDVNLFPSVRVLEDSGLNSDHLPISVSVAASVPSVNNSTPAQPRTDYQRADWDAFSSYLSVVSSAAEDRCRFEAARHRDHPQAAVNAINSVIITQLLQAADHAIPVVTRNPNAKFYWRDPAVKLANERTRAARKHRERCSKEDRPQHEQRAANVEWNAARSHFKRTVKEAKQRCWDAKCDRVFDTQRRQVNWRLFNSVTQEPRVEIGPIAADNQPLPASLRESLNRLGDFYESVSAPPRRGAEDEEILKLVHERSSDEAGPGNLDDEFALEKLDKVLRSLMHKAPGPDGISNLLVKHSPPEFRAVLLLLYNFSWRHGVLPDDWREAHVCPIYKGHPSLRALPKSYRPISLTSALVKVFERMLLERLVSFLDSKRFFSAAQSGFRQHHSTLDQVYRLIARVQESFQRREYVSVAFLDIVAAFDCVWHEGLLYKLHKAGVTGRAWRWIKAFLTDRRFRVVADGQQSDWFSIGAGVPQGSILGPFLFLIFINDVPSYCGVVVVLFADDIAVWPMLGGKIGDNNLNRALDEIYAWGVRWHLVFSPTKSATLCFSNQRKEPEPRWIWIGRRILPRVHVFKYLGLHFTPRLRWDVHSAAVLKSAQHAAYRVSRVLTKTGPSPKVVRQLVHALVIPIISYGWPLWNPPTAKHWSKLDSVVCFALRCSVGLPISVQKLGLFVEFGVVCPKLWRECSAMVFAHRVDCELGVSRPDHPAHKLFNEQRSVRLPKRCPKSCIPLAKATVTYEYRFGVDHDDSRAANVASMRKLALERQIRKIRETDGKRRPTHYAREFKLRPATASYVLTDTRQIATIRARIRLNRHHLRSRQHRLDGKVDDRCQYCLELSNGQAAHLVPSETLQHVLFECPLHARPRKLWSFELSRAGIPLNIDVLTGDYADVRPDKRGLARVFSGNLLRDINEKVPF